MFQIPLTTSAFISGRLVTPTNFGFFSPGIWIVIDLLDEFGIDEDDDRILPLVAEPDTLCLALDDPVGVDAVVVVDVCDCVSKLLLDVNNDDIEDIVPLVNVDVDEDGDRIFSSSKKKVFS